MGEEESVKEGKGKRRWHALPVHHGVCFGLEMQSAGKPESIPHPKKAVPGTTLCVQLLLLFRFLEKTHESTLKLPDEWMIPEFVCFFLKQTFDSPHRTIASQHQLLA
jgi:hypothetical protein